MQATIVISDTSCLILLEKIGELSLLKTLFSEVITTQVVADEFGAPLPDWIKIHKSANDTTRLVLESTLDKGEASTIALALDTPNTLLIIDEFKGRKIATQLGIPITGTLGILVQAKLRGHILKLRPFLEKIRKTDFRLSERLVEEALHEVGE